LLKPSTFCCIMSIPIRQAKARRTNSRTPSLTEQRRVSTLPIIGSRAFACGTLIVDPMVFSIVDIDYNIVEARNRRSETNRKQTLPFCTEERVY